ncbi:MAG: hypothetical protein H7321_05955 [Bacteroidia bacterium]|nr:hypothetical protein [Bacteroidia bacterium]
MKKRQTLDEFSFYSATSKFAFINKNKKNDYTLRVVLCLSDTIMDSIQIIYLSDPIDGSKVRKGWTKIKLNKYCIAGKSCLIGLEMNLKPGRTANPASFNDLAFSFVGISSSKEGNYEIRSNNYSSDKSSYIWTPNFIDFIFNIKTTSYE